MNGAQQKREKKMTKKDFELIANVIACRMLQADAIDNPRQRMAALTQMHRTAECMGDALADANDRFNYDKFLEACECRLYHEAKHDIACAQT
jgi:hypothetical protein